MQPSRPSSNDPNAPYRAAIAAFAGYPVDAHEDETQPQAVNAENQPNSLARLNSIPNNNRHHLNAIAHNLGAGERNAMIMMQFDAMIMMQFDMTPPVPINGPTQANAAGPSNTSIPTHATPTAQANINTIRQYLRKRWNLHGDMMMDSTIEGRLHSSNLSTETLFTAIQIADTAHHPLLASLGVSSREREALIDRLCRIVTSRRGFNTAIKTIALNANNAPDPLIAGILQHVRNHGCR